MTLDSDPSVKGDYQKALIRCSGKEDPVEVVMTFRGEYHFLSNFEPAPVSLPVEVRVITDVHTGATRDEVFPPLLYPSSENAYMAWKWHDQTVRENMQGMSPGESKKYNNALMLEPDFLRPRLRADYNDLNRVRVMLYLLRRKFAPDQNPELSVKLLQTGSLTLVEGNTWNDQFFGFNLKNGVGCNYLGRILMQVRNELRLAAGLEPVFYKMPLLSDAELVAYFA